MIKELAPQLYQIEVPLPKNPLKATNSYVIKTDQRNLVIDTGMFREECKRVMDKALENLEIDREMTDFFITHLHADHLGLAGYLSSGSSRVYFHWRDAAILEVPNFWETISRRARQLGFPGPDLEQAIRTHPGKKFSPAEVIPFDLVTDGQVLTFGDYRLECLHTPGHTPGHTCLYERRKKLLFSGDHILGDITPNISTWFVEENPLAQYLDSLDRVFHMEVDRVYPGHRSVLENCRGRIKELLQHHRQRAEEILYILEKEKKTAYQVAAEMSWDIVSENWEMFPLNQKWFAMGEAIAHLRYLEVQGLLENCLRQGDTLYWQRR